MLEVLIDFAGDILVVLEVLIDFAGDKKVLSTTIFQWLLVPFLRNKRKECLLPGLTVIQKVMLKQSLPN